MASVYKQLGQGCLFLPILLLAATLSVLINYLLFFVLSPFLIVFYLRDLWRYRRLRAQMFDLGRLIEWQKAMGNIHEGQGTLIINDDCRGPRMTAWWTQDNLVALSPVALEPFGVEGDHFNDQGKEVLIAFTSHCSENYLDPQKGKALLVDSKKGWRAYIDSEKITKPAKVVSIFQLSDEKPKMYLGLVPLDDL